MTKVISNRAQATARVRAAGRRPRAEAEARRESERNPCLEEKELSGFAGPEPTRYGDWEHQGIAGDF